MGTEPVSASAAGATGQVAEFCREIESYLCRKNGGHLMRVVGPSFDIVSRWAGQGIPLKVAFEGIDRYCERYYRKGPRRRPVKIDFCDADVLDVFDEWRRAVGAGPESPGVESHAAGHASLPEHLARVVTRLSSARASGALGADADPLIDRASMELDAARAKPGGLRGEARTALRARLVDLDRDLLRCVRAAMDAARLAEVASEAEGELAPFRSGMAAEAYARARDAAIDRLVRARLNLPSVAFEQGA